MTTLTAEDLAALKRSWITPKLADRAGLYRVDAAEGATIIGRGGQKGNYAGIVFPNFWPGETRPRAHALRRDKPEIEYHKGERREKGKYMTAPGEGNRLYFVPRTPAGLLDAPDLAICWTEGQKKTLALEALSTHDSHERRFLPIGLAGVWNWRGVNGKTSDCDGRRRDTRGPISDLSRIQLGSDRINYILFDSNVETNGSVAAARNQFALELTSRGAKVFLVDLPASDGVNGIDDYLAVNGPNAALKLFETARPFDPKDALSKLDNTDYGNEQAFEILFGEEYRYDCTCKQWRKWTGVLWEQDSVNSIDRRMLSVAQERLDATALLQEKDSSGEPVRKKAVAAVMKLRNVRVRQSAIESATSNERFARRAEDFDRDDYLFACTNGVIELKTGKFRPGRREDMLTKGSPVVYDRCASCERWLRFLREVFQGNEEMLDFIQRAVGYSLLGLTREEVFFILYGNGRNGKGTFIRVLLDLLGDYAVNTDFSTLIADKFTSKGPRNDLASMAGRRFVSAQESREGAQLDASLIKALTGGDLITARFLHKEFFTFRPTWKIWVATNHRPEIRGTDSGIWSRPKLIPFDVSFEGKEDRGLKAALLDPRELSGVLNWAIDGCRKYLDGGLNYPQAVTDATAQYKADSDLIARFLSECCLLGQGSIPARKLYQTYVRWAGDTGEESMSETAFGIRMREQGIAKKKVNSCLAYQNIGLSLESRGDQYVQ
jgi:P4 family phage/plasmid primase-like protien